MLEKISLLPRIEAVWERRARIRRWTQVISIIALIFYFLFLSLLFSYSLLITRERNFLGSKIEAYKERIKNLKEVESKQVFLKSKLKELARIFKLEKRPKEVLEDLEALPLEGISFLRISYTSEGLRIEGEARDALVLDEFVKRLEDKGRDLFSKADFGSVSRGEEGNYIFNLSLLRR